MTAFFLEVSAGVRYWEDATLDGEPDTEGLIPLRSDDRWTPVIELASGRVLNWPSGVEAAIHYKVCDDGDYWLLDADQERIAKWKDYYVPDGLLCVGSSGFGDYIIFNIGGDGRIAAWKAPSLDAEQWVPV